MEYRFLQLLFALSIVLLQQTATEGIVQEKQQILPLVINTWPFTDATVKAWEVIYEWGNGTPIDAIEEGCNVCEMSQCGGSVGFGGSPDESGETTLDAMIMNGNTHDVGAVGALRRVKQAISVARLVLEHTTHTLLVGDQATAFAVEMGLNTTNLTTPTSYQMWYNWKYKSNCQPNFWENVTPPNTKQCGPYKPIPPSDQLKNKKRVGHPYVSEDNHDTIGMVVIDTQGNIAAGTSTNGLNHKIPGRVGDSPIAGAGAYADSDVGGCAATGDGDIMMRFLPCYQAVESLRQGMSPQQAAEDAMRRIVKKYSSFQGALVVANMQGEYGAACFGWTFQFSVRNPTMNSVQVVTVQPLHLTQIN
jgi:isoaspartyl peptidase/L-asparaginase-like protein (Ntn-hydrolase superfamily)